MHLVRPIGAASLVAALIGLSACAVRAYPPTIGGYATVYADDVPGDVYAYPHVAYGSGYAYLVGDRWYYPTDGGWVVLRGEPRELYEFRADYARRAPGYRYGERQYAPPAQYGYPPPAVRVR